MNKSKPEILAPAGTRESFLAAIAAGADAIFCGLKSFSARMEAKNFSIEELSILTKLAHTKNIRVYVTLNSLVKPDETDRIKRELSDLITFVKPDAIIIQDLAFLKVAKDLNYKGEIHLSTLFNQSFGKGLSEINKIGIKRVVIPRELNVDEVKSLAKDCEGGLDLEIFIHGALCYGISGRCYWSSFLGGKSGLRGRCVQPCRRSYEQKGQRKRFFSCQDLSTDVLVKVLKDVPEVATWKIEGRKKGPHYVYYTTTAYKILRDEGTDPTKKKEALGLLAHALGRVTTHYNFLSQRPQNPVDTNKFTASGRVIGKIKGGAKPFIIPREELLKGDLLRIGFEDEQGHAIHKVTLNVPKRGKLSLKKARGIKNDSTVFLIDRREKELTRMIDALETEIKDIKVKKYKKSPETNETFPNIVPPKQARFNLYAGKRHGKIVRNSAHAVWLTFESLKSVPKKMINDYWFLLPPVIWPENEEAFTKLIETTLRWGGKNFVLNAPFQTAYFKESRKKPNLWAGPFCNISNHLSISVLKDMGFNGVFVSPELNSKDYKTIVKRSTLPLGILVSGLYPLTIARTVSEDIRLRQLLTSPMGEQLWVEKRGSEYWLFPNWKLDLNSKKDLLAKNGYKIFLHMEEPVPKGIILKEREGLWNWNLIMK
jgi:putative protease